MEDDISQQHAGAALPRRRRRKFAKMPLQVVDASSRQDYELQHQMSELALFASPAMFNAGPLLQVRYVCPDVASDIVPSFFKYVDVLFELTILLRHLVCTEMSQ
jgi:hypothetical protein